MTMARHDGSHELVEEFARHFAPQRSLELRALAGAPQASLFTNLRDGAFDTLDSLGALSAAMETLNRQLEFLVGVAASHAGSVEG